MKTSESSSLWERVAQNLQDFYNEAVGWTGEKARLGVKKMDVLGLQRQIRRCMSELGGRVYDLLQRQAAVENDARVQSLFADIQRLEAELLDREREIDRLRRRRGDTEVRSPDRPGEVPRGPEPGGA